MGGGERSTGLEDVTVVLGGGPPALRGVTLLAAPGEVLAVIGPSGSGKTTVLRAVAGLDPVSGGRVLVAGSDVTRVPTQQRNVAMVFQSTTLVPFLDVATNLARSVMARGTTTEAEAARRVADRGRILGLGRLMPRMPRTLSQGEAGLAGIGRALVRSPVAFLFDEPVAHLDAAERSRTRRTIVELVKQAGVAALYVTHDQAESMAVADRLAVLRAGEVVQMDRPRAVYDRPLDAFVAGFVGEPEIGLLPARLVSSDGVAGFRVGPRTLPLWGPVPAGLRDGQPVLLGLRAEDVGEAGPGADPGSVTLPVSVQRVERPGRDAIVYAEVTLPGEGDGTRLVARLDPTTRLRPGTATELAVDARRAHVFDAVSGRALLHPAGLHPAD